MAHPVLQVLLHAALVAERHGLTQCLLRPGAHGGGPDLADRRVREHGIARPRAQPEHGAAPGGSIGHAFIVQDAEVARSARGQRGSLLRPAAPPAPQPGPVWLADAHAMAGRTAEARHLFERLLSLRNDLGLLSEEHDPAARRMLGNFPQAFSHVPLVNTAYTLNEAGGAPARELRSGAPAEPDLEAKRED